MKTQKFGVIVGLAAGVTTLILVCTMSAWAGTGHVRSLRATCSKAAAIQNDSRLGLPLYPQSPVSSVLCGAFTGKGSNAMVVSLSSGGSIPIEGWGVFRYLRGGWQLVLLRHTYEFDPLTADGSDLRETVPVFAKTDPLCCPSGGTRSRIWHWNGTILVAGAWKHAPAKAKAAPKAAAQKTASRSNGTFFSPSHNLSCEMDDGSGTNSLHEVYCQSLKPPRSVHMGNDGKLGICSGGTLSTTHCLGNAGEHTPTLRYGTQMTVGRFRCRSEQTGITCTVIQSGKGFLINTAGIRPVGR